MFKYKSRNIPLGFGDGILKSILKNRGVEDVDLFLNLNESVVESYEVFDNMLYAKSVFLKNMDEEIVILQDFDADGMTSSSLLYSYLERIKPNIKLKYLSHENKAHGLTPQIMEKLTVIDYSLIFVPDAGSSDFDEHRIINELGKDVIILDHHECDKYSEHAIVVNNQLSKRTTNKSLTGVGMVYKFCKMLDEHFGVNYADDYLDIFALGMIADVSDLKNCESRYLVLKGLEQIQNGTNKNEFIKKLYKNKTYSMNNKVSISNVAFYMCPAVNAIIRGGTMEEKDLLFRAFCGDDSEVEYKKESLPLSDVVVKLYGGLKRKQDKIVEDSVKILSNQIEEYELNKCEIMIVNGSEIEDSTYNRIIVNKLADKYKRHCILLREKDGGKYLGSATGIKNKELSDLRQWCKDTNLFELAEGHALAHGVIIHKKNIDKLYEIIYQIETSDELLYDVDMILNEKILTQNLVFSVAQLSEVWGNGIEEPMFALEDIKLATKDIQLIGANKNTLKFKFKDVDFIKFKVDETTMNELYSLDYIKLTIIGKFKMNSFGSKVSPQIQVEDFMFEECEKVNSFRF